MEKNSILTKAYSLFKSEAERYASGKKDTGGLLNKAEGKASKNEHTLSGVWERMQTLFALVKAWSKGEYKQIPYRSLLMILVTIVYFVSPIDFVPDFLIGLGILDDAALIGLVISQVDKDLEAFLDWQDEQQHTLPSDAPLSKSMEA
ncbi:YkvA family protein [Peribacillus sp. SCS-155]|uniref:YkvA family protein n=1 Tax=Peribacillus sedimenti TaxID=3115297 RepID=UPI003905F093